ncbi:uncharacterized protein RHIMIDRAFT_238538 [Rhizopus microsporus ATCC 52813]|uniref:Uncharacterized protein n=2 Tax=Rhizopus microsporus TaxID=58291 RepID=A0A2G4SSZ4_RHIZD|nr:uncharacterized protein RHIMIDRAFT_238538 [Rhizopus microsporus ATCC 52813]PHZ11880.1 hypothetical protein RHIMIDRAFT_238538 [Rhizopus microsporus ATCC 52813]
MFKRKQSKEGDVPSKVELDNSLRKDLSRCNSTLSLRAGILAHCILVLAFHSASFLIDTWTIRDGQLTIQLSIKSPISYEGCKSSLISIFRTPIPILSVSFSIIAFISDYNYLVGLIGSYFESITFISIYTCCRFINLLEFIVTSIESSIDAPEVMKRVHIHTDFDYDEEAKKQLAAFFVCLITLIPVIFSLVYKLFLTYKVVQYQRLLEICQSSKKGA